MMRVRAAWPQVRVAAVGAGELQSVKVGEKFSVRARLQLGTLSAEDVSVELCVGPVDARGELSQQVATEMTCTGKSNAGLYDFEGTARACCSSGQYGFTIRILPSNVDMVGPFLPGLITWAQPEALGAAGR